MVGLDPTTGKEKWRALSDKGSYVSPVVIDQAGKRVTIVWTGERIAGFDATSGSIYWEVSTKPNKMPINVPGPAFNADHTKMFLAVFYDGSRLIELGQYAPTAKELWHRQGINERKTDALHCMISPPFFVGDMIYGIDSYGQIRCLDPKNGDRVWEDTTALPQERWSTGFSVQNGEKTWIVNERGENPDHEIHTRGISGNRPHSNYPADDASETAPRRYGALVASCICWDGGVCAE